MSAINQTPENENPLILAIETATRAGSVAAAKGERILSSQFGDAGVSHSSNLIECIQHVLQEADAGLSDIDLIAAAVGPGSFTGLRIGLATVKALANCTGRKTVGVSTLAAIGYASAVSGDVVSLLPAGRGELFAQRFSSEKGSVRAIDTAAHLSPRALLEKYGEIRQLTLAGEGAHQQIDLLRGWAREKGFGSGWKIVEENKNLAEAVAALALKAFRAGETLSAEQLRAVYVRPSDAEINERWQQEKAQP